MDSKLFVLPTEPDYYQNRPGPYTARAAAYTGAFPDGEYYVGPAPDARFPGWAAPLADGRLVTDYRPHCNRNIPAGKQFATHQWIQRNADEIIEVSRRRQSEMAGADRGFDNTIVPPAENIVTCDTFGCGYEATMMKNGIGTERREPVPDLFGTFNTDVREVTQRLPAITRDFEGGRNSLRGRTFQPLGTKPVGNININATYLRAS